MENFDSLLIFHFVFLLPIRFSRTQSVSNKFNSLNNWFGSRMLFDFKRKRKYLLDCVYIPTVQGSYLGKARWGKEFFCLRKKLSLIGFTENQKKLQWSKIKILWDVLFSQRQCPNCMKENFLLSNVIVSQKSKLCKKCSQVVSLFVKICEPKMFLPQLSSKTILYCFLAATLNVSKFVYCFVILFEFKIFPSNISRGNFAVVVIAVFVPQSTRQPNEKFRDEETNLIKLEATALNTPFP